MSKIRSSRSRGGSGWRFVSTRTAWLDRTRHGHGLLPSSRRACAILRRLRVASQRAVEAREEDEEQQHERSRPGARVVGRVGRLGELEDRDGNGLQRRGAGSSASCVPTSDDVKSSGAVSPATRATASTVPVTMPPIVCGSTMLERRPPARHAERRGSPRAASSGTSASTSIVERATSGSIRHGERERAGVAALAVADHDAARRRRSRSRSPGRRSRTSSTRLTALRIDARRELVQVDRDEDPDGKRHQRWRGRR